MNRFAKGLLAATALTFAAPAAFAADAIVAQPATEIVAVPQTLSPWQIRVRALGVIAENKGYVNGVDGSGLDYSKSITPELDITYYFTDNLAAELILGTT